MAFPVRTPMTRRALLSLAVGGGAAALTVAGARPASAAESAQLIASTRETERDLVATVRSAYLSRDVRVRVLLPTGYDADPAMRYPVLYLLHGSNGDADAWISDGMVRWLTRDLRLIVVMPDGGKGGWYSDHLHIASGRADWEAFHTDHLVRLVDSRLRTLAWGRGRAVAGASMGGYGAAIYAGRHPQTFGAVSCFSGATDAYDMTWRRTMYAGPAKDGENYGAIYGAQPGSEDLDHLRTRNPGTYASALVDHRVRLYAGDQASDDPLRRSTYVFRDALTAAGARDLGGEIIAGGGHDGACFDEALRRDLPGLVSYLSPAQRF